MGNISRSYSDIISVSDAFVSDPTGLTKSFEGTVALSSVFASESRSHLLTKNLEDSILLDDEFGSEANDRVVKGLSGSISIRQEVNYRKKLFRIKGLEDTINISDVFISDVTRAIQSFLDTMPLSDTFVADFPTNVYASFIDRIVLSEIWSETHSSRIERTLEVAQISLSDAFNVQWGIIVIGGTGSGSYNIEEVIQLGATTPPGFTFLKWEFNKSGISNIYDPDATLTVPYGGGVVTALFVETDSLVTVYDIFDFEFIDNRGINDEIHTNKTPSPTTGGFMGVANHDFEIPQGSRFHNIIIYRDSSENPKDLSGYTATMQIRKYKAASDPVILELNTSNGYLTLGGVQGTITIDTPGDITDLLDFKWGYYDLELYPSGDATQAIRILEGRINLNKQVTR